MKKAFIFPGQGAQYPGMGKEFVESFPIARQTLEEADDILGRDLSSIILDGPKDLLTETRNSQTGIYVISIAILKVIEELFPELKPDLCAGLSLGEYTAATAAGYLPFEHGMPLVQYRGQFMNDACLAKEGTMAVILGLDGETVEQIVKEAELPNDLWAANFNCPGQVVISGTLKGIEKGTELAKQKGAKRVLPLQVHGAFHSGLMESAQHNLAEHVNQTPLNAQKSSLIMNVTGNIAKDLEEIRKNLILQVTHPVRWEQCIRTMDSQGMDLYVEIGPGKTLAGFNKRIGITAQTVSIEKVDDLKELEKTLG